MTTENERHELTDLQRRVLERFCAWIDQHDIPPTTEELAQELAFKTASQANSHLRSLADKGWVARTRWGRTFPWWPVAYPDGAPFQSRSELLSSLNNA